MREPSPFYQMPTGIEIANYYIENCAKVPQGAEGFNLWQEDDEYCYVWETAKIDYDFQMAWLLEVRTFIGGIETRDFLFTAINPFMNRFGKSPHESQSFTLAEWWNNPYNPFTASVEECTLHMENGIKEFVNWALREFYAD